MCSLEELMKLGQDQLDFVCRTYKLPTSVCRMINAIRIKHNIQATLAEIDRLEKEISCRAKPTSRDKSNSEHLSVGTPERGTYAASDSIS